MASHTDATTQSITTGTGAGTGASFERQTPRRSLLWWAAGAGAAAGILTLALRRKQSRWQKARNQAGKLAEGAASQWKPLVGAAAAGTAVMAYRRRARPARWERAMDRAGRLARRTEFKPWITLAASTAIGLVSAYRRGRMPMGRRQISQAKMDKFANRAMHLVDRAKRVSREASKLYPQLRKALA